MITANARHRNGKLHVETVPVKLCRPENNAITKHADADVCFSLVNDVNYIASVLGPDFCVFISPDDKALCKLGVVLAKRQTTMVMALEYKVRLPNHNYDVASKHSLIPSVYAFLTVAKDRIGTVDSISYAGPTRVFIRSSKHDSSNAETHREDLESIFEDERLKKYTQVIFQLQKSLKNFFLFLE